MSKRKPRHNPDKAQNTWGKLCPYYDEGSLGQSVEPHCDYGEPIDLCKGSRHSCVKNLYKRNAIKKEG